MLNANPTTSAAAILSADEAKYRACAAWSRDDRIGASLYQALDAHLWDMAYMLKAAELV